MYIFLALITGSIVTIMSSINSKFSLAIGQFPSLVVVHTVGLIWITIISAIKKNKTPKVKVPFYFFLGGLIGVGTVFFSNFAYQRLGASLSIAGGLLGQTFFSVLSDSSGFLGRKKIPLTLKRIPGLFIAFLGIVVMAGKAESISILALVVAFSAGITSGLSTVLNAELGRKRGVLFSSKMNYIFGLTLSVILMFATKSDYRFAISELPSISPLLILGGGTMGIFVVTSHNIFLAKLSIFSGTILQYFGQTMMGLAVDTFFSGHFDLYKLIGAILLVLGLAIDTKLKPHD